MTSPQAISGVLAGNSSSNLMQGRVDISSTGVPPPHSQELIRYTRLRTLPDLLIFMHNLPTELRPTVGIANAEPLLSELIDRRRDCLF